MLTINAPAPDFTLPAADGSHSLSDYRGKKLVLYFYPKDSTGGCTKQAVSFAELYEEFKSLGCEVVGVSKDSVASHIKFAEKYNLPFTLLSDTEKEKKMYGKPFMGVVRSTFIIDEEGKLLSCAYKVSSAANALDTLKLVRSL